MKRSKIYDPRYCRNCGGRLPVWNYYGDGHGFHEVDVTYPCTCKDSLDSQILRRTTQEAEGWR
ncbi:MAG: hypothetical protein GY906_22270 [bacterium]|nr:hypothetical protein [bacterium]